MAFAMNAKLAAIILVVVPLLALALYFIIRVGFPRFTIMQKKLDQVNSGIQEALTNVRVIKSFVRGNYEEEKFSKANEDLKESSLRAFKVVIFQMPIMTLAMNITVLAVVWRKSSDCRADASGGFNSIHHLCDTDFDVTYDACYDIVTEF